jgi:hypothetical protein
MPLGVDNLIERAWEVYERFQRANGQSVDEPSFVGGFLSCYAIITGRLDVGISEEDQGKPGSVLAILERIQRDAEEIRTKVIQTNSEALANDAIQRAVDGMHRKLGV